MATPESIIYQGFTLAVGSPPMNNASFSLTEVMLQKNSLFSICSFFSLVVVSLKIALNFKGVVFFN